MKQITVNVAGRIRRDPRMSRCRRSIPTSSTLIDAGFTRRRAAHGHHAHGPRGGGDVGHVPRRQVARCRCSSARSRPRKRRAPRSDMIVRDLRLGRRLPAGDRRLHLPRRHQHPIRRTTIITRTGLDPSRSLVRPLGGADGVHGRPRRLRRAGRKLGRVRRRDARLHPPSGRARRVLRRVGGRRRRPSSARASRSSRDYPATSGVYAIDERRFFIETWHDRARPEPELDVAGRQPSCRNRSPPASRSSTCSISCGATARRATSSSCPPSTRNGRWSTQVLLEVTARSEKPDRTGNYYRRTLTVGGEAAQSLAP